MDEWDYADNHCSFGARRPADFAHHRHAGFPKVIVQTRADSAMVHVNTTLRLAPTHHFLSNSRPSECDSSWFAHFDSDKMIRHHRDVEKDLRYGLLEPEPARFWRSSACFGS